MPGARGEIVHGADGLPRFLHREGRRPSRDERRHRRDPHVNQRDRVVHALVADRPEDRWPDRRDRGAGGEREARRREVLLQAGWKSLRIEAGDVVPGQVERGRRDGVLQHLVGEVHVREHRVRVVAGQLEVLEIRPPAGVEEDGPLSVRQRLEHVYQVGGRAKKRPALRARAVRGGPEKRFVVNHGRSSVPQSSLGVTRVSTRLTPGENLPNTSSAAAATCSARPWRSFARLSLPSALP